MLRAATIVSLTLVLGIVSMAFAQSSNLPAVLQDAEKSLKAQTDKHSVTINNSIPIAKNKTEAAIPKNADI